MSLVYGERLVHGLSSEKVRWGHEVESLKENEISLVGDVLLSLHLSYSGAFNATLGMNSGAGGIEIPVTEGIDPLKQLTNSAQIAEWMNQGLPADRMSKENGAIMTSCSRWPLVIDPQLQGIKWIRNMEESRLGINDDEKEVGDENSTDGDTDGRPDEKTPQGNLIVVQITQKNWLRKVVGAIQNCWPCIIENLGEEIDSVLDPVLMRTVGASQRPQLLCPLEVARYLMMKI